MRLRGDEVRQVLAGKRTALICPVPRGLRQPYEVGRSYVVYGPKPTNEDIDDDPVARVVVANIEQTTLGEVDYRTMRKAGFKYREDLEVWWREHHDKRRAPDKPLPQLVHVLVVRFYLDRAASRRYLRPGPRGGYVEAADDQIPRGVMTDEPECVPSTFQEQLSRESRTRDLDEARRRREAPKTTPLPIRLASAMKQAERHGVDVSRQLGIIGKRIEAIERTLEDEAA